MTAVFGAWCGSIKDVAKVLGIRQHRIDHAIASGLVPEPKIRVANRRVFQEEDLANLRKYFASSPKTAKAVITDTAE